MAMMQMGKRKPMSRMDKNDITKVEAYITAIAGLAKEGNKQLIESLCNDFFLDVCVPAIKLIYPERDIDVEFSTLMPKETGTLEILMEWRLATWGKERIAYNRVTRMIAITGTDEEMEIGCACILSDILYSTRFAVWKMADSRYLKDNWGAYENILFHLGSRIL